MKFATEEQQILEDLEPTGEHWSGKDLNPSTEDDTYLDEELVESSYMDDMPDTQTTPMNRPMEPSEREMLYAEIDNLRHERDEALARVASLEKTCQ